MKFEMIFIPQQLIDFTQGGESYFHIWIGKSFLCVREGVKKVKTEAPQR